MPESVIGRIYGDIYETHDKTKAYKSLDEIRLADKWHRTEVDIEANVELTDARWKVVFTPTQQSTVNWRGEHVGATADYVIGDTVFTETIDSSVKTTTTYEALGSLSANVLLTDTASWKIVSIVTSDVDTTNGATAYVYNWRGEHVLSTTDYNSGDVVTSKTVANNVATITSYRAVADGIPVNTALTSAAHWKVHSVVTSDVDTTIAYNWRGEHALSTTDYGIGDIVSNKVDANHVSTTTVYRAVADGIPADTALTSTTHWKVHSVVTSDLNITPVDIVWRGEHDSAVTDYVIGNEVSNVVSDATTNTTTFYEAVTDTVPVNTSINDSSVWKITRVIVSDKGGVTGFVYRGQHNSTITTYVKDNVVITNSIDPQNNRKTVTTYIAKQTVPVDTAISDTSYWSVFSVVTNDVDTHAPASNWRGAYNSTVVDYDEGDVITVESSDATTKTTTYYRAKRDVPVNTTPPNTTYWNREFVATSDIAVTGGGAHTISVKDFKNVIFLGPTVARGAFQLTNQWGVTQDAEMESIMLAETGKAVNFYAGHSGTSSSSNNIKIIEQLRQNTDIDLNLSTLIVGEMGTDRIFDGGTSTRTAETYGDGSVGNFLIDDAVFLSETMGTGDNEVIFGNVAYNHGINSKSNLVVDKFAGPNNVALERLLRGAGDKYLQTFDPADGGTFIVDFYNMFRNNHSTWMNGRVRTFTFDDNAGRTAFKTELAKSLACKFDAAKPVHKYTPIVHTPAVVGVDKYITTFARGVYMMSFHTTSSVNHLIARFATSHFGNGAYGSYVNFAYNNSDQSTVRMRAFHQGTSPTISATTPAGVTGVDEMEYLNASGTTKASPFTKEFLGMHMTLKSADIHAIELSGLTNGTSYKIGLWSNIPTTIDFNDSTNANTQLPAIPTTANDCAPTFYTVTAGATGIIEFSVTGNEQSIAGITIEAV